MSRNSQSMIQKFCDSTESNAYFSIGEIGKKTMFGYYTSKYEDSSPFLQFLEILRVCLFLGDSLFICETRDRHTVYIIILIWEF